MAAELRTEKVDPSSRATQQAEFIEAQCKIIYLENEVCSLRQQLSEEKVRSRSSWSQGPEDSCGVVQKRCHKLEQDRCELTDELSDLKVKLSEALAGAQKWETRWRQLHQEHTQHVQQAQEQLQQLHSEYSILEEEKNQLQCEIYQLQLENQTLQRDTLIDGDHRHARSTSSLLARLRELEGVQKELLESQTEVQRLQRQLRLCRQDNQCVSQRKGDWQSVHELELQVTTLRQENLRLQRERRNSELLSYQYHDTQRRCEELQAQVEEVTQLRLENSRLKDEGGVSGGVASEALKLQLTELQQREIIAVRECGSLATQLSQCRRDLEHSQVQLTKVQSLLEKQKQVSCSLEDRVQRLDRRLLFVTKERDGCVNVLSSYKQDSGVDAVVREWVTELRHQLVEKDNRIKDLEVEEETKRSEG